MGLSEFKENQGVIVFAWGILVWAGAKVGLKLKKQTAAAIEESDIVKDLKVLKSSRVKHAKRLRRIEDGQNAMKGEVSTIKLQSLDTNQEVKGIAANVNKIVGALDAQNIVRDRNREDDRTHR